VERPTTKIVDALDESFYSSFGSVEPAGVPTVHAVDVVRLHDVERGRGRC